MAPAMATFSTSTLLPSSSNIFSTLSCATPLLYIDRDRCGGRRISAEAGQRSWESSMRKQKWSHGRRRYNWGRQAANSKTPYLRVDEEEEKEFRIMETSLKTTKPRRDEEFQELTVYEVNEQDRSSPLLLPFNAPNFDLQRFRPAPGLGMFVCFTNKLFDGTLKRRLGITAGQCMVIKYNKEKGGCLYEATYSLYFGEFGHISLQGPYTDYGDTELAVTGGSGIFTGVYGTVILQNVKFPLVLFYRFKLYGIPKLPPQLTWDTVPPTPNVKPAPNASSPRVAFPNFTD